MRDAARLCSASLVALASLSTLPALAAPPTFEVLPSIATDPTGRVLARGISGNGQVIAGSQTPQMWERPFIWRKIDGQWQLIKLPGESSLGHGRPVSLSYDGDTIAGMSNVLLSTAVASGTPALWTHVLSGTPTLTSPLDDGPSITQRRGIFAGLSADGSFTAGTAMLRSPSASPGELWSFAAATTNRLSPTPTTQSYQSALLCGNPLSADGSIFVCSIYNGTNRIAQRWTAATGFVPLPTPTTGSYRNSRAESLSRDGLIIGGHLFESADIYNTDSKPCLWTSAARTDLPLAPAPAGVHGRVLCLSGDGSIAGGVQFNSVLILDFGSLSQSTAVLWIDGQVRTVSTYLSSQGVDLQGVNPNWITGISDNGRTLVGFGTRSGGGSDHVSFIITLPPDCPADLNGDGLADFADYLEFLNRYDAGDLSVDFNGDGLIDFADYLEFLTLYDAGC